MWYRYVIHVLRDIVAGFSGPVRSADQISGLALHSHVSISAYVSEHPGLLAGVQGWTKAGLCHTHGAEQMLISYSRSQHWEWSPDIQMALPEQPVLTGPRLAVRAAFSPCRALTGAPMSGNTVWDLWDGYAHGDLGSQILLALVPRESNYLLTDPSWPRKQYRCIHMVCERPRYLKTKRPAEHQNEILW